MTTTMTVSELAGEAGGYFETAKRLNGDDFTRTKDGTPEWVKELVYKAHGDLLPDDWRYACVAAALEHLSDEDADPDDGRHEFADAYVDVYTSALTAWLGSNVYRPGYCDEAAKELGSSDSDTLKRIQLGQYAEAEEVYGLVLEALEERAGELEDEDDA